MLTSFPFSSKKILCWKFHLMLFKQKLHNYFDISVFTENLESCELNWEKKNRATVIERFSFRSWHNMSILYLTLAWVEKHISKVFIFHLSFMSELSVSKFRGTLDVVSCNLSWEDKVTSVQVTLDVWPGLRVRLVTCVLQVVTRCVTLQCFSPFSGLCENCLLYTSPSPRD